jgi:hypothetical protein
VCSGCDRGRIDCSGGCAGQARRQTLREAGERYQQTLRGQQKHAARMGRLRARRKIVPHHGSPPPPAGDLLAVGAIASPRGAVSGATRPASSNGRAS